MELVFNLGVKALILGKVRKTSDAGSEHESFWQPCWEAGDLRIRLGGSTCDRINLFRTCIVVLRASFPDGLVPVCVLALSWDQHVRLWWLPHGVQPCLGQEREQCLVTRMPPYG